MADRHGLWLLFVPDDPRSFEDLVSLHAEVQELLKDALAEKVCPQCRKPLGDGYGSGHLKEGLFRSVRCYAAFHARLRNLYIPPGRD